MGNVGTCGQSILTDMWAGGETLIWWGGGDLNVPHLDVCVEGTKMDKF